MTYTTEVTRPQRITLTDGPFAGWERLEVAVTGQGAIVMDRFGTCPKPQEAEELGLALIKASAIAKERKRRLGKSA